MVTIRVTEPAEYDIECVENYYLIKQNDPEKADRTVDEITLTIRSLESDPMRCSFVRDDLLFALGFRWILAKQYMIFYIYDELEEIVHVQRVLHKKSNWLGLLKGEPYIEED